ncbi:MAG TPA: DUF4097 family beta strand repeat-containing protein [Candidatus Nanoarchaeia archaeon]|nr:DUF4097 family beta strand repeat-containing protein [Candidatus Nanoarchaeia archaeon]
MHSGPGIRLSSLAGLALMASSLAFAGNTTISVSDRSDINDCSGISVKYDGQAAQRAEQTFTLPKTSNPVRVIAAQNGGVHVRGWDGNDYQVIACKAAAADVAIDQVQARASGSEVTATGPESGEWLVYFIVRAPRDASMELQATNGGIGLNRVSGTFRVNTTNGPISIKNPSGHIEAKADNGPISFSGDQGDLNLTARNGPISVTLAGTRWQGTGLKAATVNGPVSLSLPRNYGSGVVVQASRHAPVSCDRDICGDQGSTWENDKRIELGTNPVIHLSTTNGPVSVAPPEKKGKL